eukprot:gene14391-5442_t
MRDTSILDNFVTAVEQQDTHKRLKAAEEIITYVNDPENPFDFPGVDRLIDGLLGWAGSSNFKVSQYGLEILAALAEKLGGNFKSSLNSVIPVIADRLGDSKSQVREQAHNVLMKLMDPVSSPQMVFEFLNPKFSHKNWRVREELMICMVKAIETFGASSLTISKQMPAICKLLSDPTSKVRDAAVSTIVEVYRHVGEKVRSDLSRRGIPAARLTTIFAKFDECLHSGNMLVENNGIGSSSSSENVEREKPKATTSQVVKGSVRRSASFTQQPKRSSVMDRGSGSSGSGTGALDECDFVSQWEENVDLRIYSIKDALEEINKINSTLSSANNDWELRVTALKKLREVIKQYGDHDQISKVLRDLEVCLRVSVKDLRSQIVKEACLVLSFFASRLHRGFDYLAEALIPALITLIPNSVKIMSSSGNACIRLIIKHTHCPKLIPIFVSNLLTNKSKEVRSQVSLIEEAIRKGIADADSEARAAVRRAYWHFADHYRDKADALMQTFDSSKQKLLQSDKNLLQAGLTRPSSSMGRYKTKSTKSSRTTSASSSSDTEDRAIMPPPQQPISRDGYRPPAGMQRSASQLEGKNLRTPKMEPRQKSCDDFLRSTNGRNSTRRQPKRPVASQPSSRSASPARRMPSFSRERSEDYMRRISPMKTRIPTPRKSSTSQSASRSNSRAGSRDSSPVRSGRGTGNAVYVGDMKGRYNGVSGGRVTEGDLWDAYERSPGRRRYDSATSQEQHSSDDDSETSSLTSDRSGNATGSKQAPATQDINEIIKLLSSQSWIENKDGMTSLQAYLQGSKKLNLDETLRLRDVCNKFFSDPHIKVYRVFLDVLSEFIIQCRVHLNDWLFVLLTRLLHKIGSDILPSLHSKVARVLDIVRDSFPYDQQFQILTKYITDSTQTPTLKMKVAILHYLQGLIKLMDSSDFSNNAATRLAVSRIITWTSEPKSAEVRKEAGSVIVALFELNTPVFSTMLAVLPNSFQDGATKLLHSHLRPMANRMASTPRPAPDYDVEYEDYSSRYSSPQKKGQNILGYRSISPNKHHPAGYDTVDSDSGYLPAAYSAPLHRSASGRPDVRDGAEAGESVRSRLNFSDGDQEGTPDVYQTKGNVYSTPISDKKYGKGYPISSGSQSPGDDSPFLLHSTTATQQYDPKHYQDKIVAGDGGKALLSPEMVRVADGAEEPDTAAEPAAPANIDIINQITAVLSASRNDSGSEDVKSALIELIKLARNGNREYVHEIKGLLPIVTETLKHSEGAIRCLAARALREVIRSMPEAYKDDVKLVVTKLVETQADSVKEVSNTAEECCNLIAQNQAGKDLFAILCPIIESADFPSILPAIKMINNVVDHSQPSSIAPHLPNVTSALLKGYDHSESTVRKASVFCLVAIHNLVGENVLFQYLQELNGSKLKLLNLYIKRSQSSKQSS